VEAATLCKSCAGRFARGRLRRCSSRFGGSCANCHYNSEGTRCSFVLVSQNMLLEMLRDFYGFSYIRTRNRVFQRVLLTSASVVAPPAAPTASAAAPTAPAAPAAKLIS
jgi:hypothetical protein